LGWPTAHVSALYAVDGLIDGGTADLVGADRCRDLRDPGRYLPAELPYRGPAEPAHRCGQNSEARDTGGADPARPQPEPCLAGRDRRDVRHRALALCRVRLGDAAARWDRRDGAVLRAV